MEPVKFRFKPLLSENFSYTEKNLRGGERVKGACNLEASIRCLVL